MVNNKGMTLVELIVTFSLLLIIIIGMFNIIMEIKSQLDEKQIAKDFTEYSATMNNKIHYDLLKNSSNSGISKFNTFAVKQYSDDSWKVEGAGNNTTTNLFKNYTSITDDTLDSWCKNVFPCVIFGNYEDISSKKILAIQVPNGDDKEYGIYYDGVFEPVPNQDYIAESADEDENKVKPSIDITENKTCFNDASSCAYDQIKQVSVTVEVDFPLYIKGNANNYGFKIFSQGFLYGRS